MAIWHTPLKCSSLRAQYKNAISRKKKAYVLRRVWKGMVELNYSLSSKLFLKIFNNLKSRDYETAVHQMCYDLWTFPNVFLNGMFLDR
jgi:hypothetical protein